MADILRKIEHMLLHDGGELYGGEAVTQTQHALQCALLAEEEKATPELISASLLHDIGHFLEPEFDTALNHDKDMVHEDLGERFLEKWFGPAVTQPVKLHVSAKRYLCATDQTYLAKLSLQGGPMNCDEQDAFRENEFYIEAIRLRMWDDLAKDVTKYTPDVPHFMRYVGASLRPEFRAH